MPRASQPDFFEKKKKEKEKRRGKKKGGGVAEKCTQAQEEGEGGKLRR